MDSLSDILKKNSKDISALLDKHKYVSQEFQDFGYRIAVKLGDTKRASLYIKMAKEKPRHILERALSFTVDYPNAKDPRKIFMWKVKQLETEAKENAKDANSSKEKTDPKLKSKKSIVKKPARKAK